jgi:hypothetical protein
VHRAADPGCGLMTQIGRTVHIDQGGELVKQFKGCGILSVCTQEQGALVDNPEYADFANPDQRC